MDSLNQNKSEWVKHMSSIIKKYNSTEHNTIQIKPNEAVKKENRIWVSWHLQISAKRNRKHPGIKKGDMIRFKLKPSIGTKSHSPKWSSTRHKILAIKDGQYVIPSINESKMWLRHELFK